MNYTIQSINNDGSIDVSFDIDGVVQNLSGAPLTDVDALNQFLFDYGTAYENGIVQTSSPVISPDVEALVGQPMAVSVGKDNIITAVASLKPQVIKGGV